MTLDRDMVSPSLPFGAAIYINSHKNGNSVSNPYITYACCIFLALSIVNEKTTDSVSIVGRMCSTLHFGGDIDIINIFHAIVFPILLL